MLLAVLSGFLLALFAPAMRGVFKGGAGWLLALLPAGLTVYFAQFVPQVADGEVIRESMPWFSLFGGVNLSFLIDGLSLMFALLISGIGTLIVIYAGGYLSSYKNQGRFFSFLLMFMASMLGLVLADNIITFFVFWELTSITSFLLIGFNNDKARSRRSAVQALVVTGGGGLVMLAGLVLMAQVGGSLEFSELLSSGDVFRDHGLYTVILILVLGGAFTKSAQFPFHFWLPNAMEAPTPVSAYLHSATMVKAGVYLLARVNPALGGTDLWAMILTGFGAVTFLLGTILGIRQTDLKLMLAYTTVASLGLLVMLLGIGSEKAVTAAMVYLFAHSLFKGALFMVAGNVDHGTGTRDRTTLGGLYGAMPITATASLLAVLSMAGLPPFIGFLAKEVIYAGALAQANAVTITTVAVIGNILMGAVAAMAGIGPFIGKRKETPHHPHEGGPALWLGPVVLATLGLASALALPWSEKNLLLPAAVAVYGTAVKIHLHLWAGLNMAAILSGVTIAGAVVFFLIGPWVSRVIQALTGWMWGPDRGYDQALWGLRMLSSRLVGIIQSGRLNTYVFITFAAFLAALAIPFLAQGLAVDLASDTVARLWSGDFYVYGVSLLAIFGALIVLFTAHRLAAILSLGVLGFSVALIFLLFGAPDLAFTQFMVEILSVVILALVLLKLPVDDYDRRGAGMVLRDGIVAVGAGVFMTLTLILVTSGDLDLSLSKYFAENAYTEAKGKNIVNVILVDFRALDTFGEIAVLVLAGVSGLALILSGGGLRRTTADTGNAASTGQRPVIQALADETMATRSLDVQAQLADALQGRKTPEART